MAVRHAVFESKPMPKPRVLVVEDEALIRELLVETLVDAGYEVDEAASADAAAKLIEADGYKLLITDVHMPGRLDGLDLAVLAKHHDGDLPVVIVTGRPDVVGRLRKAGVKGTMLAKPFALEELVRIAARYVSPSSL